MICESYSNRMCRKLEGVNKIYANLMYNKVDELSGLSYLETLDHLRKAPTEGLAPLANGTTWGGEYMNMWIVGSYTVPAELEGKSLWIIPHTDAYETLYFRNGTPDGIFNSKGDYMGIMHSVQVLTQNAKAGETIDVALECYAGHFQVDEKPYNYYGIDDPKGGSYKHTFTSIDVCVINEEIYDFVFNLNIATQMAQKLDVNNYVRARARTACEQVFASIIQYPAHYSAEKVQASVVKSNAILREFLTKSKSDSSRGKVGIIGSSHLDTAWLWTVAETVRKSARTFSNVCALMDRYPEYTFLQSSALHLDWLKRQYPDLFERISKYIKEGRYEPNGGVWVECDCNITSGELMARQFLYGQLYTRK
ncbi:MAG: alpha-mannosidase, partial [Clostridia bacterium]|nr:alpha-mannosidase [Clostridia bacterium]